MTTGLLVGLAAVLVGVAACLAAAETALSRVSRVRVDQLHEAGARRARALHRVVAEPARHLNLLLLLRLSAELSAAAVVFALFRDHVAREGLSTAGAIAAMVLVDFIVSGVAARTIARRYPEPVALAVAPFARLLDRLLGPLPALLIALGNALTPGRGFREGPFTSEAELRDLVDLAERSRVIESDERKMIHSVFELADTLVREVMVPRTDVVWIERGKTVRQAMSLALRSGFSRIPVIGENEDDVIGVTYLKDLARRVHEGREADKVEDCMRPPVFVPVMKPVDELLRELQSSRVHVAVAVDEFGGTAGLVTIEDILEEIVGEITDEYDREGPRVEELEPGRWRVSARLPLDELGELVGAELEREDVETVGGLIGALLGKVPIAGSRVEVQHLVLTAEALKGRRNRLGTVLVERAEVAAASALASAP